MRFRYYLCVTLIVITAQFEAIADDLNDFESLTRASYIYADPTGQVQNGKRIDQPYIPASTTKLVTAWLALQHWGEDYRFGTQLHWDPDTEKLWVKGSGDPFLVSEELELIAAKIASLKPTGISEIVLDSSLFEADLVVPGATTTNNPYDALPSALAANFNTIYLKKSGASVISAEPQTPLTPFARSFASEITGTSLRINTGRSSTDSERYFAELLASLLRAKGIQVSGRVGWGDFPVAIAKLTHYNSRTLGEVIQAMLKYSTNFIANQLVLAMVADRTKVSANFTQVHQMMHRDLTKHFNWQQFAFYEGAGLSLDNQISARQLLELVVAFKPFQHLLDEVEPQVFAKTGTLTDVSTLAGFIKARSQLNPFVIMVNQKVPAGYTRSLALELATDLTAGR